MLPNQSHEIGKTQRRGERPDSSTGRMRKKLRAALFTPLAGFQPLCDQATSQAAALMNHTENAAEISAAGDQPGGIPPCNRQPRRWPLTPAVPPPFHPAHRRATGQLSAPAARPRVMDYRVRARRQSGHDPAPQPGICCGPRSSPLASH